MEGVVPCNQLPYHSRTLHVVHSTSHAFKVKQDTMLNLYVLYALGLALLQ
jgi:hypothetical protein